jgi:hypothetical protein
MKPEELVGAITAKRLVLEEHLPKVLPATWQRESDIYCEATGQLSAVFRSRWDLVALVSIDEMSNGHRWLHVSLSMGKRLPTWSELKEVKNLFIGDVLAVQVLPPKAQYVDCHPHTLHLWRCLNGPTLPGFPGEDR